MHTLFDFVSEVGKMQYGLSLLFIVGFAVFCELLRPRPFRGLIASVADDAAFLRGQGRGDRVRLLKNIAMAPVYLAIYLATVPVLFVQGMTAVLGEGLATVSSAGWSPVRAYFTGRRKAKKARGNDTEKKSS